MGPHLEGIRASPQPDAAGAGKRSGDGRPTGATPGPAPEHGPSTPSGPGAGRGWCPRSRCCPGHSRWPELSAASRGGTERDGHGACTRSPHEPTAAARAPPTRGAPPLHPGQRETQGKGFPASPGRRGEGLAWHGLSLRLCGLTAALPSQRGCSSALPAGLGAPQGSPPASIQPHLLAACPRRALVALWGRNTEQRVRRARQAPAAPSDPQPVPWDPSAPWGCPVGAHRGSRGSTGRRGRRARGVLETFPSSAAARREQRGPELQLGSLQQRQRASGA